VINENHPGKCLEIMQDAQLALVNWLTNRTEQRRLRWYIEPNVARTTIPGPITFLFITCPASIASDGWCLFSARNDHGELFRAIPAPTPADCSPLIVAVAALFLAVCITSELPVIPPESETGRSGS